ncbi:uncharacterized protein KY384_003062 [Bacidia gigantensis]|uniref:uncharacterized protein n=1 Tax=Bacidia gigantensis TaxID=2732470 RepID=UPI001D041ACD|nr:uncharacterized protein KY384_003062 [Bacidia gigantensis]KAG8531433.1 hypothetical protein KY384_003062 [Bacidia gigantensis]
MSLLTHPIALSLIPTTISAAVVGFTSPRSLYRLAFLLLILYLTYLGVSTALERTQSTFLASWMGVALGVGALQYIEVALVSEWAYETQGPALGYAHCHGLSNNDAKMQNNKQDDSNFIDRFKYGFRVSLSYRNCGTRYEVKNVAPFDQDNPGYIPLRLQFLQQSTFSAVACFLFLNLPNLKREDIHLYPSVYSPEKVLLFSRLAEVSSEEIIVRITTIMDIWMRN